MHILIYLGLPLLRLLLFVVLRFPPCRGLAVLCTPLLKRNVNGVNELIYICKYACIYGSTLGLSLPWSMVFSFLSSFVFHHDADWPCFALPYKKKNKTVAKFKSICVNTHVYINTFVFSLPCSLLPSCLASLVFGGNAGRALRLPFTKETQTVSKS